MSEAETLTVKNELKIALRRIEDLQNAIGGEMDSDDIGSDQVIIIVNINNSSTTSTIILPSYTFQIPKPLFAFKLQNLHPSTILN